MPTPKAKSNINNKKKESSLLLRWQHNLAHQVGACLDNNYIFPEKINKNTLIEHLVAAFSNDQFKQKIGEIELLINDKTGKKFTNKIISMEEEERDYFIRGFSYILGKVIDKKLLGQLIDTIKKISIKDTLIDQSGKNKKFAYEFIALFQKIPSEQIPLVLERIAANRFAKEVNDILQKEIGDLHVRIVHDPDIISKNKDFILSNQTNEFPISLPDDAAIHRIVNELNCGFDGTIPPEAQKRKNDIGYMKFNMFVDISLFPTIKKIAYQTMQQVEGKKALIIDLRDNGGGSPETVRYLASFLLEEPTHLNTIRKRENEKLIDTHYITFSRDEKESKESHFKPVGLEDTRVPDLTKIPVYILISDKTFSAAEEFAYDFAQYNKANNLDRFKIVGQQSQGGAHPCGPYPLIGPNPGEYNDTFILIVPNQTALNPYTKTNWEDHGVRGVVPDIQTNDALKTALDDIQKNLNLI